MIEKERKFKLQYPVYNGMKGVRIKQGYLIIKGKKHLRVRIIEDKKVTATLTYKSKIDDVTKIEYEYEIPLSDAIEMYESTDIKLEKTRYKTKFDGNQVDIDVLDNGKSWVEIEFKKDLKNLPDYCGEEITGNKEYSNIQIALGNLTL
jgi:CYTH domain-containing protein